MISRPIHIKPRDFVLNICANHAITRDMELLPGLGSAKAWVWATPCDIANEVDTAKVNFYKYLHCFAPNTLKL